MIKCAIAISVISLIDEDMRARALFSVEFRGVPLIVARSPSRDRAINFDRRRSRVIRSPILLADSRPARITRLRNFAFGRVYVRSRKSNTAIRGLDEIAYRFLDPREGKGNANVVAKRIATGGISSLIFWNGASPRQGKPVAGLIPTDVV